jgi:GTP pyrophosphokinase
MHLSNGLLTGRHSDPTLTDVLASLSSYHPRPDLNLVKRAYVFAEQHHRPQLRKSGDPYIGHPVAVAHILCGMRLDVASVCAALLHDTVEDTEVTLADVESVFNTEIAEIVDGVTKIGKLRFRSSEERQAENFRKMLVAMSRDIRVILVKLADRTHNMRTLDHLPAQKQVPIARETMDIFAPIANRLGLGAIKCELEDLSFRYLHPEEYEDVKQHVATRLDERKEYTGRVLEELSELVRSGGIEADVSGRPKHFWSIYRKMQAQRIPFDKVYDMIAFRVIVDKSSECYHALGLVHENWRPVPGRFKDYIALPKPNKYQSLHTAVIGPEGQQIEVQFRTQEMHRVAEGGIAAHWRYKEQDRKLHLADEERFEWLKRLMEWQKELDDPNEFLESVKVELFADEVFTFTPRGELRVLPRGSTPVDFAYGVHSEIGNTCSGAIVNGSIVPLEYVLRNGDTVEILTNRSQKPNKDWLRFVRSNRAKARIKAHIKSEQRDRSLELGEQLLDRELRRYARSLVKVRKTQHFKDLASQYGYESGEELVVQVGMGQLTPETVVAGILGDKAADKEAPPAATPSQSPLARFIRRVTGGPTGVVVDGLEGVKHTIAKCCSPVPGESIQGFVTPGHVISVHRRGCVNTLDLDPTREVEVRWGSAETGYPVGLEVTTETGVPGLLNKLTKVFSDLEMNIDAAICTEASSGRASNVFRFHAKNLGELNQVVRRLETLKGVFSVQRIRQGSGT